jgi:putative sigma-54 modulation protein
LLDKGREAEEGTVELQIRANNITVNDELEAYAVQRVSKLDRLVDRVVDAKLELKHRKNRTGGDVTAQLTIQTGRRLLRAEEQDHDVRRAIDLVTERMAAQIRRFHDKRTDKKGRGVPGEEAAVSADVLLPSEEDGQPEIGEIVRTKRFAVKPMMPEEAIEQMELLGHDFFLFHNADEEQLNVLYRRNDGTYGLLAPHKS